MRDGARDVVMNVMVKGVTRWRICVWAGTNLIRLAAAIIGCQIVVKTELEYEESDKQSRSVCQQPADWYPRFEEESDG